MDAAPRHDARGAREAPGDTARAAPRPAPRTEVTVGAGVREFVAARGGRLYVWAVVHRCCTGGLALLETDVAPPARRPFAGTALPVDGFELSFDAGRRTAPRTLVLELARRGRRVNAYWNGCAFAID